MRLSVFVLVMLTTATVEITQADIGEKLRLGQPIKRVPQDNFGAALSITSETNLKNVGPHHDYDENNLDRLCNDPFHSFLCKPVGPRKIHLDGRLRPGANLPNSVLQSGSSYAATSAKLQEEPLKTGSAILSSGIEPASSFNAPGTFVLNNNDSRPRAGGYLPPPRPPIPSQTQQVFTTKVQPKEPSKEYLPSNSSPVLIRQDNIQIPLPLVQPQQTVIQYAPVVASPQASIPISSTNFFIKSSQIPNPLPTTLTPFQRQQLPLTARPPLRLAQLNSLPTDTNSIVQPSNQYLPIPPQIQPIDIRVSPASTNLSPLIEGGSILAEGRQPTPDELRQQLSDGSGKKHSERQHTLEELCNDAFHSFLCQPITKPRKRIDGRIRPGAKIPPHVLQGAHSFDSSTKKLLPLKEGSAILSEGREPDKPVGYAYPKPQNPLLLSTQATNIPNSLPSIPPSSPVILYNTASPSTNIVLPASPTQQQFLIKETIIPAVPTFMLIPTNNIQVPLVQTSVPTIQKPLQNLIDQATFVNSQKIPISIIPRPAIINRGNPFISASTISSQKNDNVVEVFKPANQNVGQSSKQVSGYSYSKPAGAAFPPPIVSSSAQLTPQAISAGGYDYPKPSIPFTLPTSTTFRPPPTSKPNILYIPSVNEGVSPNLVKSENQIVTTELPIEATILTTTAAGTTTSNGYVYQRPSITFPSPSNITTQNALATNNQPNSVPGYALATNNQPNSVPGYALATNNQPNSVPGYSYPRPAKPFSLPPIKNEDTGYSYPRPAVPFTLPPPKQPPTNIQQFGYKLTPITTNLNNELNTATLTNNINNLPLRTIITTDNVPDDPLPPASQFEIIKP